MTTVRRRDGKVPRYQIWPIYDQELGDHVFCVVDTARKHWATGSDPAGYRDRESAEAKLAELRRKEQS